MDNEYINVFFTSVVVGGEFSASRFGRFSAGTLWKGGWVGLRGGLDNVERREFFTQRLPLPHNRYIGICYTRTILVVIMLTCILHFFFCIPMSFDIVSGVNIKDSSQ
jgi:hypothetical protein